jgi:hypothetical protein
MQIRIDIKEKLDLSKFRKQATHYLGQMRELSYHFYLPNYRVLVESVSLDDTTAHLVTLWIEEIKRDTDYEILTGKAVIPIIDTRFKESKIIQELFPNDHYKSSFQSNNTSDTVNKICQVVKLVYKINNLKAFL